MATFVPHAQLAGLLGAQVLEISAGTVGELLDEIALRVGPEDWAWAKRATLLLNGRNVHQLQGRKTQLAPTDQLWMVLPSGGG